MAIEDVLREVALMALQSSQPVKTFSVGFPSKTFTELPYAKLVADQYETEHHEMIVEPNMTSVVPQLVKHYGEPFADTSAIPTWCVSRLARERVPMVLSGDGADEAFAGYGRYGNWMQEGWRRDLQRLVRRPRIQFP